MRTGHSRTPISGASWAALLLSCGAMILQPRPCHPLCPVVQPPDTRDSPGLRRGSVETDAVTEISPGAWREQRSCCRCPFLCPSSDLPPFLPSVPGSVTVPEGHPANSGAGREAGVLALEQWKSSTTKEIVCSPCFLRNRCPGVTRFNLSVVGCTLTPQHDCLVITSALLLFPCQGNLLRPEMR